MSRKAISKLPKVLRSIYDLESVFGKQCEDCWKFYAWNDSIYDSVEREGDNAVFRCSKKLVLCKKTIPTEFETTAEQIKGLEKDVGEFLRTKQASPEGLSSSQITDVIVRAGNLIKRIGTYAAFAPADLKMQIDGVCQYCLSNVPIKIEKRKIWIACPPCATQIADEISG